MEVGFARHRSEANQPRPCPRRDPGVHERQAPGFHRPPPGRRWHGRTNLKPGASPPDLPCWPQSSTLGGSNHEGSVELSDQERTEILELTGEGMRAQKIASCPFHWTPVSGSTSHGPAARRPCRRSRPEAISSASPAAGTAPSALGGHHGAGGDLECLGKDVSRRE